MDYEISLSPSNKNVLGNSEEAVLDSLLTAGIAIKYNCSNGSCGKCRARLISGELQHQHHDFHFKEHEKSMGNFLMCRCTPKSDIHIEADLIGSVEDVPEQNIATKVYKIEQPSDDVRVITLRTPRSHTLQFLAGQHIRLSIDGLKPRNKSIASCPCNGRYLQFHFNRQEEDEFTDYIFNELGNKATVDVTGPYGSFVFDEQSPRPIVLIATETGFAPIKSLAEHIFALEVSQPIYLYWCVQNNQDDYFSNYCRAWLASEDNFSYQKLALDELGISGTMDTEQAQNRLAEKISEQFPDLSAHDVYLSGPRERFETLISNFCNNGLPQERLSVDSMQRY